MENVDFYEISLEDDVVTIAFTDIFGDGERMQFPVEDACKFTLDMVRLLR